jgi:hypothetical protein
MWDRLFAVINQDTTLTLRAPSTACTGEPKGATVKIKAMSGAASRLIQDLNVMANLVS